MPDQFSDNSPVGTAWRAVDVQIDDNNCIAKRVFCEESEQMQYFLKRCTTGVDAGKLYDPLSTNFDPRTVNKFYSNRGVAQYEFKKVSQECYETYMRFVETQQPAFCRQAERLL